MSLSRPDVVIILCYPVLELSRANHQKIVSIGQYSFHGHSYRVRNKRICSRALALTRKLIRKLIAFSVHVKSDDDLGLSQHNAAAKLQWLYARSYKTRTMKRI